MALTLVFVAGCISMAELVPPALRPNPPGFEAPPDTLVEPTESYADTDPSALVAFRPLLARYGSWVDDEAYGVVWVPDPSIVGPGFIPYLTAGHWVFEDDYAWVSDYAWGWLPFHYGRWVWSEGRGWAWIPGRTYAAAWVMWRTSRTEIDYIGWAPMPPAFVWRTLGNNQKNLKAREFAGAVDPIIEAPFVFCPASNLFSRDLSRWMVAGAAGFAIAKRSEPYVRRDPTSDTPLFQAPEHGPTPPELRVTPEAVRAPSLEDKGLALAKRYALPTTIPTSASASASAPSRHWVRVAPPLRLPRSDAPHTYRLTTGT